MFVDMMPTPKDKPDSTPLRVLKCCEHRLLSQTIVTKLLVVLDNHLTSERLSAHGHGQLDIYKGKLENELEYIQ